LAAPRVIRVDLANSSRGRFDRSEHRRRLWKKQRRRARTLCPNVVGLGERLSYYVILAHDLRYLDSAERDDHDHGVSEVRRMLTSLERVSALAAERTKPTGRRRLAGRVADSR
jgi:hypothetical protein